ASVENMYAVEGDQTVNAAVTEQLSNTDLKWESSYQANLGLELGFFYNRITASFDYHNIDTEDVILGDSSAPVYIGFSNVTSLKNIGEINNKGFEISLSTKNIYSDNFSWTTDLNWSTNKNEVIKLIGGQDVYLNSSP